MEGAIKIVGDRHYKQRYPQYAQAVCPAIDIVKNNPEAQVAVYRKVNVRFRKRQTVDRTSLWRTEIRQGAIDTVGNLPPLTFFEMMMGDTRDVPSTFAGILQSGSAINQS